MDFFGMFTFSSIFILIVTVIIVINVVRAFSKAATVSTNIKSILEQDEFTNDNTPKSLRGMDSVYAPQILADFPDFNISLAKTNVKNRLREMFEGKDEFRIHNVVICNYVRSNVEKTIFFQAALQYREGGRLCQKRYELHYAYLLPQGEGNTISANCPNCGGVISSSSQKICEFCDSMLVNVMGNSWEFTEVFES